MNARHLPAHGSRLAAALVLLTSCGAATLPGPRGYAEPDRAAAAYPSTRSAGPPLVSARVGPGAWTASIPAATRAKIEGAASGALPRLAELGARDEGQTPMSADLQPSGKEVSMRWTPASPAAKAATKSATQLRMQSIVVGEGPRLVLIGGGLTGWKSWEPHAERLAGHRTVARLQLLSVQFGLENRPLPDGYSVAMESRALAGALDALGWSEPVDLVAWSHGALVALDFVLDHPDRVRTLTLIEPPAAWVLPGHGLADPDVQALQELAETLSEEVSEADLERFVRTVALAPPGATLQELPQWPTWMEHRRSLRSRTTTLDHRDDPARLRRFDRPVLLVTGTGTAPFLRQIHETLAAALPRARTVEMPAGHAPQLVSMDRFLDEVARFQASEDAAR